MSYQGVGESRAAFQPSYTELIQDGLASGALVDERILILDSSGVQQWTIPTDTLGRAPFPFRLLADGEATALEVVAMIHVGSLEENQPFELLEGPGFMDQAAVTYAIVRDPNGACYVRPLSGTELQAGSAHIEGSYQEITERGIVFESDIVDVAFAQSGEDQITGQLQADHGPRFPLRYVMHVEGFSSDYERSRPEFPISSPIRVASTGPLSTEDSGVMRNRDTQVPRNLAERMTLSTRPVEPIFMRDLARGLMRLGLSRNERGIQELLLALEYRQRQVAGPQESGRSVGESEAAQRLLDAAARAADELVTSLYGLGTVQIGEDGVGPLRRIYRKAVNYTPW